MFNLRLAVSSLLFLSTTQTYAVDGSMALAAPSNLAKYDDPISTFLVVTLIVGVYTLYWLKRKA